MQAGYRAQKAHPRRRTAYPLPGVVLPAALRVHLFRRANRHIMEEVSGSARPPHAAAYFAGSRPPHLQITPGIEAKHLPKHPASRLPAV